MTGAVGLILAGGRGTRLGTRHPDLPKPLIPCLGRPFIEWVIRSFADQGLHRFIISLGHRAAVAEAHFRTRPADGPTTETVREEVPQGTGGGVRLAWSAAPEADVVVANGDSLILTDLAPAWKLFSDPDVDAVILGVHRDDASRYGTLRTGADGRLLAFEEKRSGAGLVNAGVYLLKAHLRTTLPDHTPLSMEMDVIPQWLAGGAVIRVHACRAPFIDIGTPESLDRAGAFLAAHFPVPAGGAAL
jgi:NDP-sugar pyrophosphorylase family protein